MILDTKNGKKITVFQLGGKRGALPAPPFSAPCALSLRPMCPFQTFNAFFCSVPFMCAPMSFYLYFSSRFRGGFRGPSPTPFSPKIYHKMLVKLKIWDRKIREVFFLFLSCPPPLSQLFMSDKEITCPLLVWNCRFSYTLLGFIIKNRYFTSSEYPPHSHRHQALLYIRFSTNMCKRASRFTEISFDLLLYIVRECIHILNILNISWWEIFTFDMFQSLKV